MKVFCLIYPDAVFNGAASHILKQLERAGIRILAKIVRKLNFEETQLIFFDRRLEPDFEEFCRTFTVSQSWLLKIECSSLEKISSSIKEEYFNEVFITFKEEHNLQLLSLVQDSLSVQKELEEMITSLRQKINLEEREADKEFTYHALKQGDKLYSYFISMQVAGFDSEQAFRLTSAMQQFQFEVEMFKLTSQSDDDDDDDDDSFDDENADIDDDST